MKKQKYSAQKERVALFAAEIVEELASWRCVSLVEKEAHLTPYLP